MSSTFFFSPTHPLIPKQPCALEFRLRCSNTETSLLVVCDFKRCDFGNLTKPPKLKCALGFQNRTLRFGNLTCVLTLTTHSNNNSQYCKCTTRRRGPDCSYTTTTTTRRRQRSRLFFPKRRRTPTGSSLTFSVGSRFCFRTPFMI
ncbi:hypothetical protein ACB098_01G332700 [Castanea mollissima]